MTLSFTQRGEKGFSQFCDEFLTIPILMSVLKGIIGYFLVGNRE